MAQSSSFRSTQHNLRISGKEYLKRKGSVTVPAKKYPMEQVPCKCKNACKTLTFNWRMGLFEEFYKLKSENEQGTYLLGFMSSNEVARRRNGKYESPVQSRRQCTMRYSLPTSEGKTVLVCKSIFMDTFGLSHRFVQTLQNRKKRGISLYKDKRGKVKRPTKFSPEDKLMVLTDIQSYPKDISHYGRTRSDVMFLSSDLSINLMFRKFKEKEPTSIVSYKYYYKIFKSFKPRLSFRQPRVDTCADCDQLKCRISAGGNDGARAKIILQTHHRAYQRALKEMNLDHVQSKLPTAEVTVLSIDMQQVIPLPTLTHSSMYYSRQLNCYNFGVHEGNTDNAYCFIWTEVDGYRGSSEVASCLLKLINSEIVHDKLILWSDNCCGQNKNRSMIFLMIWLVSMGIFKEVTHKFLLKGHSFLACDRDFAHIEKKKRKSKLHTPKDICKLITGARFTHPMKAIRMHQHDFFNVMDIADSLINTKKIPISKVCMIKVDSSNPTRVACKDTFIDFLDWSYYDVLKKNKSIADIQTAIFTAKPSPGLPLAKKNDLKAMIPFLSEQSRKYYYNIVNDYENESDGEV